MDNKNIVTRFAPSPTGLLHIGNARMALVNWLYTKKFNGKFILRIDDTDIIRSKEEYVTAIKDALEWLGLSWDESFHQISKVSRYQEIINSLIKIGRVYPCYETQLELDIKRKTQLANGRPPIYDRSSLKLSAIEIEKYKQEGKKPHYRFLINSGVIRWKDLVKGDINFDSKNISDPIVVREDGSMTYLICSTIDDIDCKITHIIRGEDHITNTAIQIQMFNTISSTIPEFGHLSLITTKENKISKRVGGFSIRSLQEQGLEPMAVNSFLSTIGTSNPVKPYPSINDLIKNFNITNFSVNPTVYLYEELERLNHKLLCYLDFQEVRTKITEILGYEIDENFWLAVRNNLNKLEEIKNWWQICYQSPNNFIQSLESEYLNLAINLFPEGNITSETWNMIWTKKISEISKRKGKELYLPLRLALTGQSVGQKCVIYYLC